MKSGAAAGFVAGIVGGIVSFVFAYIGVAIGLISPVPGLSATALLTSVMVTNVIWGIIFGFLYARFYDPIPGRGIMKGLYYGLLIWLVSNIRSVSIMGLGFLTYPIVVAPWGITYLWGGFWAMVIAYGPVLAALYKK